MAATKQPNVGWLYYKNYYKGINWHDTKDSKDNKAIFDKANKEIFENKKQILENIDWVLMKILEYLNTKNQSYERS